MVELIIVTADRSSNKCETKNGKLPDYLLAYRTISPDCPSQKKKSFLDVIATKIEKKQKENVVDLLCRIFLYWNKCHHYLVSFYYSVGKLEFYESFSFFQA